jgi:hypothetical protein
MNLFKLTDSQRAALRQTVANECRRRSRAAVEGRDAGAVVYGNEIVKRALVVAAAGKHSLLLLGPRNSGKTMLLAVAVALGLEEVFLARLCPCGEYGGGINSACRCTVAQIGRHRRKLPVAEINIEVRRPTERDVDSRIAGTSLADMERQIGRALRRDQVSSLLDGASQKFLRACIQACGLDPLAETTVRDVALTIAALDRATEIRPAYLNEAVNYRALLADGEAGQPRRSRAGKRAA